MNKKNIIFLALFLAVATTSYALSHSRHKTALKSKHHVATKYNAHALTNRKDVQEFINIMVDRYQFKKTNLEKVFNKAHFLPDVLAKMNHPYEEEPWNVYRKHFLTDTRINGGVVYWYRHYLTLKRAEKIYGVPPDIIVSIIGIESMYGKHTSEFSVLNSLATLSFKFPKRAEFFRSELAEYLLLTKELHLNPNKIRGSYAGAMGLPQFMPSSYRKYAVDFDGNSKKDLFHDTQDVIGSIANYLHLKGWQRGGLIAISAHVKGDEFKKLLNHELSTVYTLNKLKKYGVTPSIKINKNLPVNIIELKYKNGHKSYWLGFHNFYVITKYNTSDQYAMAALALGNRIRVARYQRIKREKSATVSSKSRDHFARSL